MRIKKLYITFDPHISEQSRVNADFYSASSCVQRGLVVSFCAQPHYCYRPYYPTAGFPSPSSYTVSDEPFPDRSRPIRANLNKWGLTAALPFSSSGFTTWISCDCCQRQTMNHTVDTCPSLTKFEVSRRTFPVAASLLCNSLPSDIQSSPSLPVFRRRLQTFLFRQSFPNTVL